MDRKGVCGIEGGRWKMEDGRWKMEGGGWRVERRGAPAPASDAFGFRLHQDAHDAIPCGLVTAGTARGCVTEPLREVDAR